MEYALLAINRKAPKFSGVLPTVELLNDGGDFVGVDFAHGVGVSSEAFRPDFDFRDGVALDGAVPHADLAVLVWECFAVEPDAAHAEWQGVPVSGECFVEVFGDDSDAVVGFYGFCLDVFGGLE